MKLGIICGSHRKNSQSFKVSKYIEKSFTKIFKDSCYLLNLGQNPIPLWDESIWQGDQDWKNLWDPISAKLEECNAFIFVVPDWSGMAPSGVKNLFLMCGGASGVLAHKPSLLVGVSSARGGRYPIAELRMSSYKNTRICHIPEHLIIGNVEQMLEAEPATNEDDKYLRGRIDYSLKVLDKYAEALDLVRASNIIDAKTYPFGM